LFPHRGIPHNIWIDKNGVVRAITGGGAVTAENILGFDDLQKRSEIKIKQENLAFEATSARFSAGDTSFTYRSIITPRLKGIYVGGELYVPKGNKIQRFFMWGVPMLRAYWAAYSGFNMHMRYNLMEIHTQDSLKFYPPYGKYKQLLKKSKYKTGEDWEEEHTYFYDLTLPDAVPDTVFRNYMFNDLERQFKVKAKIEMRNISCIVVSKSKGEFLKLSINNAHNSSAINMLEGYKFSVRNSNIQDLVEYLFKSFGTTEEIVPDPFVNTLAKSDDKKFDLDLDFSKEIDSRDPKITPEMFYEKLGKYGFKFKKEIKSYPILVLYDQDNK
jgi:hypothetical protein